MLLRARLTPHRTALVVAFTPLLLVGSLLVSAADEPGDAAADEPVVSVVGPTARQAPQTPVAPAFSPPARKVVTSHPHRDPRGISRTLARYVDAVPPGEHVKVETYFLGSSVTYPALVRAFERGVHVQVILNGSTRARFPQGPRLAALLDRDRTDRSWVVFTDLSARGPEGVRSIDHNKVWRFSRVGDRRWVTVAGSYNNSDEADRRTFSMMWSLAHKPVYDAIERIFQQSRLDRRAGRNPMRRFAGAGWSAYFLPSTSRTATSDPVMRELRRIPADPRTRLRVAMFTMWDSRGLWIAERLAAMARRGARITFVAGPLVGRIPVEVMRSGGVRIEGGCWPGEGTYVHDKAWSASYERGGRRHRWTWIGSDNWTTHTMSSDQTVVGIAGRDVYRQFARAFRVIAARPDVDQDRCDLFP